MAQSNAKPPLSITMRDVARAAGVSAMTVSRALKTGSPVSEETRERILRIARDMDYVPDWTAGSLTTKRSDFVATLVPSLNNIHFAETVQALTEELESIGRRVLLGHTGYDAEREERLVEAMLRHRPEALVLSYDGHSDRAARLLRASGVPVIELWERPDDPIDHVVGFSNRQAAAEMARALIARGHRRIAFLGETGDDRTRGAERRKGFVDAMRDAGLSPRRQMHAGMPPMTIADGADALPTILERFPDADCIFCVSDAPAFGALAALSKLGVRVPEDIGIAGFGDFEVSRFASPAISTVAVDPRRIGAEAGRLIGRLLGSGSEGPSRVRIDIPARPELRGSTNQPA